MAGQGTNTRDAPAAGLEGASQADGCETSAAGRPAFSERGWLPKVLVCGVASVASLQAQPAAAWASPRAEASLTGLENWSHGSGPRPPALRLFGFCFAFPCLQCSLPPCAAVRRTGKWEVTGGHGVCLSWPRSLARNKELL